MKKCSWALGSQLEEHYHDYEWGVPVHDDRLLFEFLVLEGAQAGLSWLTILKKREGYRQAFDDYDLNQVAYYQEEKIQQLMLNSSIIRNRLKIRSVISNAQAFLNVQQEYGSFDSYIWGVVDGAPKHNQWAQHLQIPSSTTESENMSKDLKKRGFKFVGATICYTFMQATGMVNDHVVDCYRYQQLII